MLNSDWFVHVWEQGRKERERKRRRSGSRRGGIKRTQKQKSLTVFHEKCVLRAEWHWHFYRHLEIQGPPSTGRWGLRFGSLGSQLFKCGPSQFCWKMILSSTSFLTRHNEIILFITLEYSVCSFFFFFFGRLGVRAFCHLILVLSFQCDFWEQV